MRRLRHDSVEPERLPTFPAGDIVSPKRGAIAVSDEVPELCDWTPTYRRSEMKMKNHKPENLGQACGFAVVAQLLVVALSSFLGHEVVLASCLCIIGHWLTVCSIVIRRRRNPTKADLIMARSGFFVYLGLLLVGAILYTQIKRS